MTFRDEKLKEALMHAAAEFVERNSNRTSLITVTNIRLSEDGKNAIVLISILPNDKEKAALEFLKRQRSELRAFIKEKVRVGRLPRMDFDLDLGEKNRQKIDELSR